MSARIVAALLLGLVISLPARSEQATVAVAANFAATFKELAVAFQSETGHTIVTSIASSGRAYAQIINGAPFDVFLSADSDKPRALIDAGLADPERHFTYAIGRLMLCSHNSADPLAQLKSDSYTTLALANPRLAPYGAAAVQTLQMLGLDSSSANKQIQGENIAQTFQFFHSGNVDLAFLAASQIATSTQLKTRCAAIPAESHHPIRQDAVLLKRGRNSAAATALTLFLLGPTAAEIIQRYGYQTGAAVSP